MLKKRSPLWNRQRLSDVLEKWNERQSNCHTVPDCVCILSDYVLNRSDNTINNCPLIINTIYNCQIAEKWNGWWSDWWLKGWGRGAHLLPREAIVARKNKQTLPKAQWTQWTHRVLDSFNTFNFTEAIVVRKNKQTLPKAQWTFFINIY